MYGTLIRILTRATPFVAAFIAAACAEEDSQPEETTEKQPRPDSKVIPRDGYSLEIETFINGYRVDVPPFLDAAQTPKNRVNLCERRRVDLTSTAFKWAADSTEAVATFRARFASNPPVFEGDPKEKEQVAYQDYCVTNPDPELFPLCQESRRYADSWREGAGISELQFKEYELDETGQNRLVGYGNWGDIFTAVSLFDVAEIQSMGALMMADIGFHFSEDPAASEETVPADLTVRLTSLSSDRLEGKKTGEFVETYFTGAAPAESDCLPVKGYLVNPTNDEDVAEGDSFTLPFLQDLSPFVAAPLTCDIPEVRVPEGDNDVAIGPVPCCTGDDDCVVHAGMHVDSIEMGLRIFKE